MVRISDSDQSNLSWITSVASQVVQRVKKEFKILYIEFKSFFYDLKGDVNRSEKYEFTGEHLNLKKLSSKNKKKFKEELLVTTHNLAQRTLLKETTSYEQEVQKLSQTILQKSPQYNEVLETPLIKKEANLNTFTNISLETKNGICVGMCVDLASQLLNTDFNSPQFEDDLKRLVSKFEYGGGPAAVANQYVYKILPQLEQYTGNTIISVLDKLEKNEAVSSIQKEMIEYLIASLIVNDKVRSPLFLNKILKDLHSSKFFPKIENELGKEEALLFITFMSQLKTHLDNNEPFSAKLVADASTEALQSLNIEFSSNLFAVGNWLTGMTNYLNQISPKGLKVDHVDKLSEKSNFSIVGRVTRTVKKFFDKMLKTKDKDSVTLMGHQFKRLVELQNLRMSDESHRGEIARARGIQFLSMENEFGLIGAKSDEEYLENLQKLKPGTYEFLLGTREGKHATLFIKAGNGQGYLFDPNFGLFKCDQKDPAKTIMRVLENYETPDETELGITPRHNLQLRQAALL